MPLSIDALIALWPAILGLLLYAFTGFGKNRTDHGEPFDAIAFLATTIVTLIVGGAAIYAGDPLSEVELQTQVAAYAGVIVVLQNVLEIVIPLAYKEWLADLAADLFPAPIGTE